MRAWWNRFRSLLNGREAIDGDLAEELRSHIEMEADSLRDRGLTDQEARAAASRRFGNATWVAERAHDAWVFSAIENLLRDVRFGWRAMLRTPALSLVLILTFALGVGLNAAIFSVVHTVLLKPLPYPGSERLVILGEANAKGDFSVSWGNLQYWRADSHSFDGMAGFHSTSRTLTGRGEATTARGMTVTAGMFPLLGMRPLMGRLLGPADDLPGAPDTVVLTQAFWAGRFGGDPHVVGSSLPLNGKPFEVVGVATPAMVHLARGVLRLAGRPGRRSSRSRRHGSIRALARLKPGVTLAAARADLDAIMRHLAEIDPGPESDHHSHATFFTDDVVGGLRGAMTVLMGAAVLILLIACANITSLLLARQTARSSELALRKAIGAGQGRPGAPIVYREPADCRRRRRRRAAVRVRRAAPAGGHRAAQYSRPDRYPPRIRSAALRLRHHHCAGFLAGLAPVLLAPPHRFGLGS